jgi:fatty acid desaturase
MTLPLADSFFYVFSVNVQRDGNSAHPETQARKLAITLATLIAVIILVSFGLLPIVTAATAGCAVLMLTGCLRPIEAYRAIDLSLVLS